MRASIQSCAAAPWHCHAEGVLPARRAEPIAARVIGDVLMITLGAGRNVTAEGGSPTVLDCGHHLQLWQV